MNSRSDERLSCLSKDLGHPERLLIIHGSLLLGYASKTVHQTVDAMPCLWITSSLMEPCDTGEILVPTTAGMDQSHMIQDSQGVSFLQSMTSVRDARRICRTGFAARIPSFFGHARTYSSNPIFERALIVYYLCYRRCRMAPRRQTFGIW